SVNASVSCCSSVCRSCTSNLSAINFLCCVNDTATPEIYTLSLHDALPILATRMRICPSAAAGKGGVISVVAVPIYNAWGACPARSEEHTSELQSRENLVCRLLLEKKKLLRDKFTIAQLQKLYEAIFNTSLE